MTNTAQDRRLSLGNEDLYLFKARADSFAENLVISAHGGISQAQQRMFAVPWGRLVFYSVHGQVTGDYGVQNFVHGGRASQRTDTVETGEQAFDYLLSKYQGKHARDRQGNPQETYTSIGAAQDYADEFNLMLAEAQQRTAAGSSTLGIDVANVQAGQEFDVLTVRNRHDSLAVRRKTGLTHDVRLSTALAAVGTVHQYSVVHCYFCRSFL